jgi:CRISPR-associated protein Cas1
MLNEYAYCPRLCYIEWVECDFRDSADTVEGRFVHRRVDVEGGKVRKGEAKGKETKEEEGEEQDIIHARSVFLTGPEVGITCRIDLLEADGNKVTPIDYKRGSAPDLPEGAWEPERVQLCAQALVLRENGYECTEGVLYYAESKSRVPIPIDDELAARTMQLIMEAMEMADGGKVPPPLQDSPKCVRCSLAGICLPDELNLLAAMDEEAGDMGQGVEELQPIEAAARAVRRLVPARDDSVPVYIIGQGNVVRKKGDRLEVRGREGKVADVKLREVSQLSLYGAAEVTAPALIELLQRGVPICHMSHGGWFYGISQGMVHKNVELRMRQYAAACDERRSLDLAKRVVSGKIRNCRTLLKRNDPGCPDEILDALAKLADNVFGAADAASLLGIEGTAAQAYFSRFDRMLKTEVEGFSFENRNKRPPRDPINAVLSYLYGVLAKELFVTLLAVGFDPYLGFYHRPRYGRPALALDMMEEFRPIIADSVAITLLNNAELGEDDFVRTGLGVAMTQEARRTVIKGYERRMSSEVTHPVFGYTISYRRVLEVQARLLSRVLSGEIAEYRPFCTR